MNLAREYSSKLVLSVYDNKQFLGVGVPFKFNSELYLITAGHVIVDTKPDKETLIVKSVCGLDFCVSKYIGLEFAKQRDLVILKLEDKNEFVVPEIYICSTIENGLIAGEQIFCTKLEDKPDEDSVDIEKFDKNIDENFYQLKLPKGTLVNFKDGSAGSDEYKGISGSGVFYFNEVHKKIYLTGILSKIKDTSINDTIKVCKLSSLEDYFEGIVIENSQSFDTDARTINTSLEALKINKIEDNAIEAWLLDDVNENSVKNINRKVKVLKKEEKIKKEITRIIRNLIRASQVETHWKNSFPDLAEVYESFYDITSDSQIEYEVLNRREAVQKLQQFTEKHKENLEKAIGDFNPQYNELLAVSEGDISKLLAACDLDFEVVDE